MDQTEHVWAIFDLTPSLTFPHYRTCRRSEGSEWTFFDPFWAPSATAGAISWEGERWGEVKNRPDMFGLVHRSGVLSMGPLDQDMVLQKKMVIFFCGFFRGYGYFLG